MRAAELWIRCRDGRTLRERYNQVEMAAFMQAAMLRCVRSGVALQCFDDEQVEIPAERVAGIELVLAHDPGVGSPTAR